MPYTTPTEQYLAKLQKSQALGKMEFSEIQGIVTVAKLERDQAQAENEAAQKFATMTRQQRRYQQRNFDQAKLEAEAHESVANAGQRLGLRDVPKEDQQRNLEAEM